MVDIKEGVEEPTESTFSLAPRGTRWTWISVYRFPNAPVRAWKRSDARRKRRRSAEPARCALGRRWRTNSCAPSCHEFGCNWSLITDAFAAGTPIKGTYHRIEHCRWRFSHLTQIAEQEQNQQAIAALNLNKGSARTLMALARFRSRTRRCASTLIDRAPSWRNIIRKFAELRRKSASAWIRVVASPAQVVARGAQPADRC